MMIKDINKSINRALSNIKSSFMGTITSISSKDGKVNAKAGADNEARDIVIITPYGYYSLPDKALEAQVIFNNSARRASMVGVNNFPFKPVDIAINEVVIFNKKSESYIYLKNDGSTIIKSTGDVNIESEKTINVKAADNINLEATNISLDATSRINMSGSNVSTDINGNYKIGG